MVEDPSPETDSAEAAQYVCLRLQTHLPHLAAFDPSIEGVPPVTVQGTWLAAEHADTVIAKAAEHDLTVVKVA